MSYSILRVCKKKKKTFPLIFSFFRLSGNLSLSLCHHIFVSLCVIKKISFRHETCFFFKESEKHRSHAISRTSLHGMRLINELSLFFQLCFLNYCAPIPP